MPSYRWEPGTSVTGRYRDVRTGRFVPPKVVRDELDRYLLKSADPVKDLAQQLRDGAINLDDWHTAMRRQIKNAHLNAMAEAVGGYNNMTPADYGRAGQRIREEYGFLRSFADDIASGKQRLDGTLQRRAQMYIDSARKTYYRGIEAATQQGRVTHIRSVLNPADHCQECVALNKRWYRISDGNYTPPGFRECRSNCKCSEEYGIEQPDGTIKLVGSA
jgi:hypothetical protein